jgi:hypothetical protein
MLRWGQEIGRSVARVDWHGQGCSTGCVATRPRTRGYDDTTARQLASHGPFVSLAPRAPLPSNIATSVGCVRRGGSALHVTRIGAAHCRRSGRSCCRSSLQVCRTRTSSSSWATRALSAAGGASVRSIRFVRPSVASSGHSRVRARRPLSTHPSPSLRSCAPAEDVAHETCPSLAPPLRLYTSHQQRGETMGLQRQRQGRRAPCAVARRSGTTDALVAEVATLLLATAGLSASSLTTISSSGVIPPQQHQILHRGQHQG